MSGLARGGLVRVAQRRVAALREQGIDVVMLSGDNQLGKQLKKDEVDSIVTFLKALTGELPKGDALTEPKALAGGKDTPKPDPT